MAQTTWCITGVSSGFGRLMTERLLERGDRVAGTVRKMDSMDDLKDKHGDLLWLAHLDMTDLVEIRKVLDKAFAQLGRIDVIVSNAGYGLRGGTLNRHEIAPATTSSQESRFRRVSLDFRAVVTVSEAVCLGH